MFFNVPALQSRCVQLDITFFEEHNRQDGLLIAVMLVWSPCAATICLISYSCLAKCLVLCFTELYLLLYHIYLAFLYENYEILAYEFASPMGIGLLAKM